MKKPPLIKSLNGKECPFFCSNNKSCSHKANGPLKTTSKTLCPYVRNRRRCPLWCESSTYLKSSLESLKIDNMENNEI